MTDKELLLLAVKAAGIEHFISDNGYRWEVRTGTPADGYYKQEDDSRNWNPLINDGDALRLAVKLNFGIVHGWGNFPEETALATVWISHDGKCVAEEVKGYDEYAATRRAIVRAAAQIGRGTE